MWGVFLEKKWKPKVDRAEILYINTFFNKEGILGFKGLHHGKINIWGKWMEDEGLWNHGWSLVKSISPVFINQGHFNFCYKSFHVLQEAYNLNKEDVCPSSFLGTRSELCLV